MKNSKISPITWLGVILLIVGLLVLFTVSTEAQQTEDKECYIFGYKLPNGASWLNPLCGIGNTIGDFASSTINVAKQTAKIIVGLVLVGLGAFILIKEYGGLISDLL